MKYLSVIVFAVLLTSTWYIINSEAAVPLETHAGIQARMSQLIVDTVKAKKPSATNIEIQQLWTEPYGSGTPVRVKAHFTYRFTEPSADNGNVSSVIEGEGLLEKKGDDESGFDRWTLTDVKTNNDAVIFEQALVITTGSSEAAPEPATTEVH